MFKNKYFIIGSLSLLAILIGLAVYFGLNSKEEETVVIDKTPPTTEEKNLINNIAQSSVDYYLLLDKYKEFSHSDIISNFNSHKDDKYLDYIKSEDNKNFYMELLFGYKQDEVYQNSKEYAESIKELLTKNIADLTLEEKLKIDAYYARIDNGAMDVFKFNNFEIAESTLSLVQAIKSNDEKEKILRNKEIKYLGESESITKGEKEVLLYLLVADYYLKGMDNKYINMTSDEVKQLTDNKEKISAEQLAHLLYDNYIKFKISFSEIATYKNKDAFVTEDIRTKTFKLSYKELEDEFNKYKNKSYEYGTYEAFVISEYVSSNIFSKSKEEVQKIYDEVSKIKVKDMTTEEYFKYAASDAYLGLINSNSSIEIEHYKIEFDLRYGDDNQVKEAEKKASELQHSHEDDSHNDEHSSDEKIDENDGKHESENASK